MQPSTTQKGLAMRKFRVFCCLLAVISPVIMLQAQTGTNTPALDIKNVAMFQETFAAVKSHGAFDSFEWPGFYQISNSGEQPITITGINVLWAPASFEGKQLNLISRSKPEKAVVFNDQNAVIESLRKNKRPSPAKFPISIPPHSTRYFEISFMMDLSDGQNTLRFQNESDAYPWLSRALGWKPGSDGKFRCLAEDVPVEVTTADGQPLKYSPRTVLLVPGCLLTAPPGMKPAKP